MRQAPQPSHSVSAVMYSTAGEPHGEGGATGQVQGWPVRQTQGRCCRAVLADVLKYFGCELGAQTNFDKATGTSIVNGQHDTKKLMELLEGFIKKFVQCYSCGNPETQIKIKKELLHLKCKVSQRSGWGH